MMLRVGLTGGIASGKSAVARTLAGLGCYVIDADAIVTRLYRPGGAGHEALVRTYGPAILRADGEIDRPKVAAIAFENDESASRLNQLIHPLVIAEQQRMMEAEERRSRGAEQIAVVEATLLLESGGRKRFDKIVVVDVDPEIQVRRGVARGMDEAELRRRIARQMPRDTRLGQADYVIDNNGDLSSGEAETRRVYEGLRRDLAKDSASS
jgi:dephospho-CoA kinase